MPDEVWGQDYVMPCPPPTAQIEGKVGISIPPIVSRPCNQIPLKRGEMIGELTSIALTMQSEVNSRLLGHRLQSNHSYLPGIGNIGEGMFNTLGQAPIQSTAQIIGDSGGIDNRPKSIIYGGA